MRLGSAGVWMATSVLSSLDTAPAIIASRTRARDVLGADTEADEPAGDAAQARIAAEQARDEGGRHRRGRAEHRTDHPVLDRELDPLRDARGPLASPLDARQVVERHATLAKRPGQDVGGGDRVLDREVDADARH